MKKIDAYLPRYFFVVKGFTLIELLIVIAIIGILATLVLAQVASAQIRARNSAAQSDVNQSGKAVETWRTTTGADTVTISMIRPASGNLTSAYINDTLVRSGWTSNFNTPTTAYPVSVTKTPGPSIAYGYQTDAAGNNYCIATNQGSGSGLVVSTGFAIVNGSSKLLSSNPVVANLGSTYFGTTAAGFAPATNCQ
jgi:prepilin-type N-terminal cleavage/methylation domain-containing protein